MQCPRCRLENPPTAQRCDCGYDFPTGQVRVSYLPAPEQSANRVASFAGLVPRVGALLIDASIFWAIGMGIALALGFLSNPLAAVERARAIIDTARGQAAGLLFFVLFEASAWQGTPGKRLLRLRVEEYEGGRVSVVRSLARNLAKAVSGLLFPITILHFLFSPEHRALHDLLSGTCVLQRGSSER